MNRLNTIRRPKLNYSRLHNPNRLQEPMLISGGYMPTVDQAFEYDPEAYTRSETIDLGVNIALRMFDTALNSRDLIDLSKQLRNVKQFLRKTDRSAFNELMVQLKEITRAKAFISSNLRQAKQDAVDRVKAIRAEIHSLGNAKSLAWETILHDPSTSTPSNIPALFNVPNNFSHIKFGPRRGPSERTRIRQLRRIQDSLGGPIAHTTLPSVVVPEIPYVVPEGLEDENEGKEGLFELMNYLTKDQVVYTKMS